MKTALWLNPITTGSTVLDPSLNPHDVEEVAQSAILREQGYKVLLHVVNKVGGKPSYPDIVQTEDLQRINPDKVIISTAPFLWDFLKFRYYEEANRSKPTRRVQIIDQVCDFLEAYDGDLSIFIPDPRPAFQWILWKRSSKNGGKKFSHRLYDILEKKCSIIAPCPLFIEDHLKDRIEISDYWKRVYVGPNRDFSSTTDFFCVYPGMNKQRAARKTQVREWMLGVEGCYTAGDIILDGIPSLTEHKRVPLPQVLELTARSTTSLISGEPDHTWLTPRVIQSLCQGTICSIHPDFPGRHHFPDDILQDQTFETAEQFDHRLLTAEIYQRQLSFVRDLRNGR